MKTQKRNYQIWWGVYLQETFAASSDEEAVAYAKLKMSSDTGWLVIRLEVVYKG